MIEEHRRKPWPIGKRLSFIILFITGIALLIAFAALITNNYLMYQREQDRKLEVLARVIAQNLQAAVVFDDTDSATSTLTALQAERHITFASIYSKSGTLFAYYRSPGMGGEVPDHLSGAEALKKPFRNFYMQVPIQINNKHLATLFIESDKSEFREMMKDHLRLAFIILIFSMGMAAILSERLQRSISVPLTHLTRLAQRVSEERDYSVRAKKEREDEVGILMDNFNQMLVQIQHHEETLFKANRELEESNKDLEQFAYIASHDLQEPLRKIISFSDRLMANVGRLSDAEKADFLNRLHHAAHRMKRVIEDLLQFSKTSRADTRYEKVSLQDVMNEVLSDLDILISQSHARITIEPLPDITANRSQMRHLFQNLITNAVKFAKKDVPPVIEIRSELAPDKSLEIHVRDNGIGFDEKYLDKIFKPFQRLHAKDEYEGTGIGLAIVERIVRNHRGTITARSSAGEGATFVVTLPPDLRLAETPILSI